MKPDDILFFGITMAQFEKLSIMVLPTALIVYMLFIIGNLARQSKAGRYGTLWMFIALGLGFVGFIAKTLIEHFMDI